jgi:hypothetical protein
MADDSANPSSISTPTNTLRQAENTGTTLKKFAVLIAIENYQDPAISQVPFARRDAEEFSNALELNGFEKNNQLILIDEQATKGAIESLVPKAIEQLKKKDLLFFYYAGHGFSKDARNFITAFDTLAADWADTSLSLGSLLGELKAFESNRIALFLDCCESNIQAIPGIRNSYGNLNVQELESFLKDAKHCLCFAACKPEENSYPSGSLKHGIWMHHVIEAFQGEAILALERGLLTANSLQNYLKAEVPRTLRKTFSEPYQQTPWMHGIPKEDFVLADLRPILQERRDKASNDINYMRRLGFTAKVDQRLTSLSGWRKTYRIPDRYTDSTQSFVSNCASDELKKDLDSVFEALKRAFKFGRRDLVVSQPEDGTGSIITPYFNYSVHIELNADDLGEVIWIRTVDSIVAPEQISTAAFSEVFDGVFDTLELSLPTKVQIEDFIDAVEAARITDVSLDYDRDATYCDIQIAGANGILRLSPGQLSLSHSAPTKTAKLIESFVTTWNLIQKQSLPFLNG